MRAQKTWQAAKCANSCLSHVYSLQIKGWCHKGDIRATQYKNVGARHQDIPEGVQDSIKKALETSEINRGKDEYVVDLEGHQKQYWLGTESGLLPVIIFEGACTEGDGSCDRTSGSMGAGVCNRKFRYLVWDVTFRIQVSP